ncbi:MAG: sporulation protein YqfC [Anaeromicrobium sp.]|jgi:sporulation protein YqfC|uniref:sporulation protein YqfC n=1 Tax=Anaeromicrobium sp. TaxID=1929132 RepID=UPI0025EC7D36|nr:sporulation protein YqfC [Anaeromicrobium sp.]MCT4594594.1 sporulation protein YqfC [Anaeromicrobium sp.]
MKNKNMEIRESLAELLELPKDIILDLPRITMLGNLQLYIENHKGIIEYTKVRIRVKLREGSLRVIGKDLTIKNIMEEEIVICGELHSIEFMK